MSVMFILLPVALIFSGVAFLVFLWAARAGQFDDLETPALRVLHEDDEPSGPAAVDGEARPAPRRRGAGGAGETGGARSRSRRRRRCGAAHLPVREVARSPGDSARSGRTGD